jgi:hypothetical protein
MAPIFQNYNATNSKTTKQVAPIFPKYKKIPKCQNYEPDVWSFYAKFCCVVFCFFEKKRRHLVRSFAFLVFWVFLENRSHLARGGLGVENTPLDDRSSTRQYHNGK